MNYSIPVGRQSLANLVRSAGDVIRIADAQASLQVSRSDAAKRLARWAEQGWLRRVGPGLYAPAALDSLDREHVLDDPWVLVPALYGTCYVGGRTAAEHWDLTEQLFNDIVVLTTKAVSQRNQRHHGARFTLKHVQARKIFGTTPLWRHRTKVEISDVHRTIVDMLDDPALGGGMQHVADCLTVYLGRADRDDARLIDYANRVANGAVFKRLGFLSDGVEGAVPLSDACARRLTAGNAQLDPAIKGQRLVTKWRLWIPQSWVKA